MTSILTYCKLLQNPSKVSAGNELTNVGNQLKLPKNEHVYEFSRVFTENCKSNELYAGMVDDVTKYFLGGYNACVFITGHFENLKSFLSGGFLHACVEEISNEISKRNKFKEKRKSSSNSSSKKAGTNLEVRMGIYEIFQERIVDLVTVSSEPPNETVKLVEDSFDGNVIRDEHCLYITDHSVKEATRYITVALDKSSLLSKNQQAASIVLELSLKKAIEGFEVPVSTWFRIVCLAPNFLKDQLNCNLTTAVSRKTSTQNQTISTADTLIKKVLADPIGGNCITKCCFVLEPVVQPNTNTLLSCLGHLRKVFNYPVDNTPHIKGLLRQYRNKVTYFEREMFREKGKNEAYAAQLKEQIARLEESNEKLMTEKIGLQETLTKLQTEQTVAIKTELSDQNKFSITEKLQMSKDAVELQLYANHLQQEAEEQLFEMKNKCLAEESKSSTLDRNLAYERKLHKDLKVKFDTLRLEHSELLEEYINLKTNYKAMCDKYHEQGEVNHDLNAAVTKLSHLKDKIVVEKNESHFCAIQGFSEKLSKLKQDILTISESLEVNAPKSSNMVSSSTVDVELLYQLCEDEFQELEHLFMELYDQNDPWNGVSKKVREFTMSVQHNLEKEKAQLLTRCHLAEQQLESYHDFMKETTQRYDLEISHLKYLLNDSYNMKAKANFSYDNQLAIPHGDPDGFLPPINQPYNGRYHQR